MIPRQVLQADLRLAVAIPLGRRKSLHRVMRRPDQRRRHRDLILGAGRDVKTGLPHNGHVEMMHQGHFKAFAAFVVVTVVEGLDVEEHRVAVVLARLGPLRDGREEVTPVGFAQVVGLLVQVDLGEVDLGRVPAADAVVGAEVPGDGERVSRRGIPLCKKKKKNTS